MIGAVLYIWKIREDSKTIGKLVVNCADWDT